MKFQDANEVMSEEELAKMIAETMLMADRPRTWYEWFISTFFNWN